MITRSACGRTIRRIVRPYVIPSDFAASVWPLSTDRMPALTISLMYAPSLIERATIPARTAPRSDRKPICTSRGNKSTPKRYGVPK